MSTSATQPQTKIRLPYRYDPRHYQIPMFKAIDIGQQRRFIAIWHRRAGKDKSLINLFPKRMMQQIGVYYYFFPTYNQGRKILWEGIDKNGLPFLAHFPKELIFKKNDQEMMIQLVHPTERDEKGQPLGGSIFRVIGTDKIDSVVGTNPIFCVFSEYSLQNPRAWDFIRPILAENGGIAIFNYTPRGHNHGKQLWDTAQENPDIWWSQRLTVDDTKAIAPEVLEQERKEMLARTGNDGLFMQEYYVSFDAPIDGAYYGHMMMQAEKDQRIGNVPYDPALPVHTSWDLGIGDSMAVWFFQAVGQEMRFIDYYENNGEGLTHYIKYLKEKEYIYGKHYAPHDIQVRELTSGKSRWEIARGHGITFETVANESIEEGIEAVRTMLPRAWFDRNKCQLGINALNSYHKEFDDKHRTYKTKPVHDWASHGADAMRMAALGFREGKKKTEARKKNYDPITGRLLS